MSAAIRYLASDWLAAHAPCWLNDDVILGDQVSADVRLSAGNGEQIGQHVSCEVDVQYQHSTVNTTVLQFLGVLLTHRPHTCVSAKLISITQISAV